MINPLYIGGILLLVGMSAVILTLQDLAGSRKRKGARTRFDSAVFSVDNLQIPEYRPKKKLSASLGKKKSVNERAKDKATSQEDSSGEAMLLNLKDAPPQSGNLKLPDLEDNPDDTKSLGL